MLHVPALVMCVVNTDDYNSVYICVVFDAAVGHCFKKV